MTEAAIVVGTDEVRSLWSRSVLTSGEGEVQSCGSGSRVLFEEGGATMTASCERVNSAGRARGRVNAGEDVVGAKALSPESCRVTWTELLGDGNAGVAASSSAEAKPVEEVLSLEAWEAVDMPKTLRFNALDKRVVEGSE